MRHCLALLLAFLDKRCSKYANRIFDNSSSMLIPSLENVIDTNQKEKNKLASGYVLSLWGNSITQISYQWLIHCTVSPGAESQPDPVISLELATFTLRECLSSLLLWTTQFVHISEKACDDLLHDQSDELSTFSPSWPSRIQQLEIETKPEYRSQMVTSSLYIC